MNRFIYLSKSLGKSTVEPYGNPLILALKMIDLFKETNLLDYFQAATFHVELGFDPVDSLSSPTTRLCSNNQNDMPREMLASGENI